MSAGRRLMRQFAAGAGLWCLLLACGSALAGPDAPAVDIGNDARVVLSRSFSYLDDSDAGLALAQILQPAVRARFIPVTQVESTTNFGATRSAIWLKPRLRASSAAPPRWLLESANPALDRLDLYVSNAQGGFDHQAEQDTRTALARQQELNDLRSRFVAMTSHEFRTSLATILSSQDLLKHYHERLPEGECAQLLDIIAAGVHRMTRMLDRVLLLGQAEAQMLEFQPMQIDLRAVCEDMVSEVRKAPRPSPGEVVLDWSGAAPGQMYDDKLLRHIFNNLLSNAIKYSPAGGRVQLRVAADGAHTVFEVSDEGIGIPADEIAHLFESFHRAGNVGVIHGTGLCLAIVKNAVDLHRGTVTVHRGDGPGARFTVRLG